MKKFLLTALFAVLSMTLVLTLASCETGPAVETTSLISTTAAPVTTAAPETTAHVHSYTNEVTPPTCTEKGYTTYTCSCGDKYVDDYTDALGHSFGEWVTTKAATCTAKGTETRTCSRCNTIETRETAISAHQYVDTVTAPTKTEKGHTTHACAVCGNNYVDSYTNPTGSTGLAYETSPDVLEAIQGNESIFIRPVRPLGPGQQNDEFPEFFQLEALGKDNSFDPVFFQKTDQGPELLAQLKKDLFFPGQLAADYAQGQFLPVLE